MPLSDEAASIDIYASDLLPGHILPAEFTRTAYVPPFSFFFSFCPLSLSLLPIPWPEYARLTCKGHRNSRNVNARIHIPFASIAKVLQEACETQLAADINAAQKAMKPRKPKAKGPSGEIGRLKEELRKSYRRWTNCAMIWSSSWPRRTGSCGARTV